jgi:DNA-binding NarL/FixJ family response regulator
MKSLTQSKAPDPSVRHPEFDEGSSDLLERILKLPKRQYELFLELGQGWEMDEIAKRLNKEPNAIYVMAWRMRPKLGIKTIAMLRFQATRYLLSGIRRQDRQLVFPQEQKTASAA